MNRKWVVISTKQNKMEVYSRAQNLGELKRDMSQAGVDLDGLQIVVRNDGGKIYENDSTMLPQYQDGVQDAIFLTPSKTKNG